jgi:hypothetical protein
MGACGHVLSWQALNVGISQGTGSSGACPVQKPPRCSYRDEVDWADRWRNLARLGLPR